MCVLLGQCTGAVISFHRRKFYFIAGLVVCNCVEFHNNKVGSQIRDYFLGVGGGGGLEYKKGGGGRRLA